MLRSVYVVGGQERQADSSEGRYLFGRGLILRLDIESGRSEVCVDYVSPPEACPEDAPSILFKTATLQRDQLVACTETEILTYRLPSFERTGYLSLPQFNDLHHVRLLESGRFLVANTGLDMVLEIEPNGHVVREWAVADEDPWTRFDRNVDYRRVVSTKPHAAHPNYVFEIGGDIWVTRFEQRDAICLTNRARRIRIGLAGPHDGAVFGDRVYFSSVDGQIVIASHRDCRVERKVDLNRFGRAIQVLGWCRGLHVVDGEHVLVGFSRLRPTQNTGNLRWIYAMFPGVKDFRRAPTRVALYDIGRGRRLWERVLEDAGMNAIFSIHPAET